MSTTEGVEKVYAGFTVQVSQVFDRSASDGEIENFKKSSERTAQETEKVIRPLLEFFVAGKHPYKGLENKLDLAEPKEATRPRYTVPLSWRDGVWVFLHVKSSLSPDVERKLRSDFILAQFSPGGPLSKLETKAKQELMDRLLK